MQQPVGSPVKPDFAALAEPLAELCKRHGIRELSVCGSVLHDDFAPHSDVDFVVDMVPAHRQTCDMWSIQDELTRLCQRQADVLPKWLAHQALLAKIERDSKQVLYALEALLSVETDL